MQQAARYLFDLDFSAPPEPEIEEEIEEIPPEPMITVAEHERLLAQAVAQARSEAETAARADRERLASEETLRLQQSMLDEIAMIYTEVGTLLERLEKDASNLAYSFASKFAEKLVAKEPKTEILALLHQILGPLRKTPHISIRLNETIADDIKTMVDQQMDELGFNGKLSIIADPAVMIGDCEVEWADGGIGRNLRNAMRQVEQLLDDHFAHIPDEENPDDQPAEGVEADIDNPDSEQDHPSEATNTEDDNIEAAQMGADMSGHPMHDQHEPKTEGEATPASEPVETAMSLNADKNQHSDNEMTASTGPMPMETEHE